MKRFSLSRREIIPGLGPTALVIPSNHLKPDSSICSESSLSLKRSEGRNRRIKPGMEVWSGFRSAPNGRYRKPQVLDCGASLRKRLDRLSSRKILYKLKRCLNFRGSFTIIESIMVIVVIGILAMLAVPRFEIYYGIKVRAASKKLISDIRYAQSVAISRHTDTRIIFDSINESYQVDYYDSGSSSWQPLKDPFTRGDLIIDFSTTQFRGTDISSIDFGGAGVLRFNWEGIPQDTNGIPLVLAGSIELQYGGRSLTVNVTPQTGRVSW